MAHKSKATPQEDRIGRSCLAASSSHFRGVPAAPYQPSCTLPHPCLGKAGDRVFVLSPEAAADRGYHEPAATWQLCPEAALELHVQSGRQSAAYFSTSLLQAELGSPPCIFFSCFLACNYAKRKAYHSMHIGKEIYTRRTCTACRVWYKMGPDTFRYFSYTHT